MSAVPNRDVVFSASVVLVGWILTDRHAKHEQGRQEGLQL